MAIFSQYSWQRSLVGCSPRGCKKSVATEYTCVRARIHTMKIAPHSSVVMLLIATWKNQEDPNKGNNNDYQICVFFKHFT